MDGTLLDHHSYSCAPAIQVLEQLRERAIPLVLASSKTRAEMEYWQDQLRIRGPFICENGAAICESGKSEDTEALTTGVSLVRESLSSIRDEFGYNFVGFGDCDVDAIVKLTGLSPEQAALALQREYSEPLLWRETPERLSEFLQQLSHAGLQALQGGRFLTVSAPCDKALALAALRDRYLERGGDLTIVALGDSENDISMLAAADIGVVIRRMEGVPLVVPGPRHLIRSQSAGPTGWAEVMSQLLNEEFAVIEGA